MKIEIILFANFPYFSRHPYTKLLNFVYSERFGDDTYSYGNGEDGKSSSYGLCNSILCIYYVINYIK